MTASLTAANKISIDGVGFFFLNWMVFSIQYGQKNRSESFSWKKKMLSLYFQMVPGCVIG